MLTCGPKCDGTPYGIQVGTAKRIHRGTAKRIHLGTAKWIQEGLLAAGMVLATFVRALLMEVWRLSADMKRLGWLCVLEALTRLMRLGALGCGFGPRVGR